MSYTSFIYSGLDILCMAYTCMCETQKNQQEIIFELYSINYVNNGSS